MTSSHPRVHPMRQPLALPLNSSLSDGTAVKFPLTLLLAAAWGMLALSCVAGTQDPSDLTLPSGVKAVWDSAKCWRETTATRERLSINGLWRWQPAADDALEVPAAAWGYYKVPACWPGIEDYM